MLFVLIRDTRSHLSVICLKSIDHSDAKDHKPTPYQCAVAKKPSLTASYSQKGKASVWREKACDRASGHMLH